MCMKKLFLTLLFIGAIFTNIDAQNNIKKNENSFIKDRISFNIGGGYNSRPSYYEYDRIVMSFEGLYGFNNWLEAGAYFSYLTESFVNTYYCEPGRVNVLDYGLKGRAHILPLIIKPSFYMVDIYGNLEVGGHSVFYRNRMGMNIDNNTQFCVNAGGGIGFNFNKFFGIFYECNYSNIYKLNHRYGFMFRF